jgi:hypothetical protein
LDTTDPAPAPVASKEPEKGKDILVSTSWWEVSNHIRYGIRFTVRTGFFRITGKKYFVLNNTFCTIHIRNVLNATNEGASGACRTVQVVQSIFLPFPLSVYPWREDPTSASPVLGVMRGDVRGRLATTEAPFIRSVRILRNLRCTKFTTQR